MVLKNARILPQLTPEYQGEFADIVLDGDRIAEIAVAGSAKGDGFDLQGKTLLPGFIDAHVHLDLVGTNVWEENYQSDATRTMRGLYRAYATMKAGFTTLRDLGDRNNINIDLAAAIEQGYVFGPDVIASGCIVSPSENGNEYFEGMYLEADGCDEVLKATRKQIQRGAKWVKYMGTGAYMNPGGEPGAPIYTLEEVDVMVKTANMHGIPVAGHNHGASGILTAIKAGVRTVEHSTVMTDEVIEAAKNSTTTFLCPTLGPFAGWSKTDNVPGHYLDDAKRKMQEESYGRFYKAYQRGLKLGFGTDAGVYENSHGDNTIEFKARVNGVGMAPADVLVQATKYNAEILMIDHEVGTVQTGKKANLVVIDGKPDVNINDIDRVDMVIKSGKVFDIG